MTKGSYADKRDANEAEIILWLRERGCKVIQMPRGAGYDLQVFAPGGVVLPPIEIKNPQYSPVYTSDEKEMRAWCYDNDHRYLIIETVQQMAAAYTACAGKVVYA